MRILREDVESVAAIAIGATLCVLLTVPLLARLASPDTPASSVATAAGGPSAATSSGPDYLARSPDGQWIVYSFDTTGKWLYVRPAAAEDGVVDR